MQKGFNTPVLLIAFNRPELTKLTLDQIKIVKPRKLYIAVDGARNEIDLLEVNRVKNIIKKIDWDCQVKTLYQKTNLGCKLGPVTAISWFFKNEKSGIILEDDLNIDTSFFYYCQELLEKYKDNLRVGTISGNNFTGLSDGKFSYMFSRYSQTWGWATWRRVWDKYDVNISDWPEKKENKWLDNIFSSISDRFYWKLIFDAVYSKELDSAWDYQLTYLNWSNNFLSVIPSVNLVSNIGIGIKGASHTLFKNNLFDYPRNVTTFPLKHPPLVKSEVILDKTIQKSSYILYKEIIMNLVRKLGRIKRSFFV